MNLTLPNQYDFLPRFLRLSIVNILSIIVVPLAGLVSVGFLGHLTEISYLTGVALGTIVFNFIYYIFLFLRMSATGLTAQAVGRDDREAIVLVGLRNSLIALGIGVVILILQYPLREVSFALLNGTPEVKAAGVDYFNARIWGAPAILVDYVLFGWLLGRGESGKVLLATGLSQVANIVLNYLFIVRWNWGSTGAGLATAISEYVMLLVAMIFFCLNIKWEELRVALRQLSDWSAFKATFTLNGNLFVTTFITNLTFTLFNNLSAGMETIDFAKNVVIFQVGFLVLEALFGVALATETLTGNFKGQEASHKLMPLLTIAGGSSLLIGLTWATACVLFPRNVFGLITDHAEVIEKINTYAWWLLSVLGFGSISLILDGYFIGLTEGRILRNITLAGFGLGFAPLAVAVWYSHNNNLLWLSLSMFFATKLVMQGLQLPKTFTSDFTGVQVQEISQT